MHHIQFFDKSRTSYPQTLEQRLFSDFRGVGIVAHYLSTKHIESLSLDSLIGFLETFHIKPPCGASPHHTGKVDFQSCQYRRDYIGCAHPELSGLFYAFTLGNAIIQKVTGIPHDPEGVQTLINLMEADYSLNNDIEAIMNEQTRLGERISELRNKLIISLRQINSESANSECTKIFEADLRSVSL